MEIVWLAISAAVCFGMARLVRYRRKRQHEYLIRGQFHQAPVGELGTDEQRRAAMADLNPFAQAEVERAQHLANGRRR